VRTSLIVLFQGIEYLMKMEVSKESALLLIESNKVDWPSLPQKKDKDFDQLPSISGESLLSVFCALPNNNIDLEEFEKNYEELRINRNKLVHSAGVSGIEHPYLIKKVLYFMSAFYEPTDWIDLFRQNYTSNPGFGYWDWDIESAYFYKVLNFVESNLTKGELNMYLKYNIKSRRYFCPSCTHWLNAKYDHIDPPKWAFLKPNSPESKVIDCLICGNEYIVDRKECNQKKCKGNVLSSEYYEDQCLTCSWEE